MQILNLTIPHFDFRELWKLRQIANEHFGPFINHVNIEWGRGGESLLHNHYISKIVHNKRKDSKMSNQWHHHVVYGCPLLQKAHLFQVDERFCTNSEGAVNFEKLYEKLSLKFKLLLFPVNFCWEKLLVHICISRCNLTQANDENHTYFLLIIWDNIRYMPYIMQSASKISQNTHFMNSRVWCKSNETNFWMDFCFIW